MCVAVRGIRLPTAFALVGETLLHDFERVARSAANRIRSALIVAALLVASALLARVHDLR